MTTSGPHDLNDRGWPIIHRQVAQAVFVRGDLYLVSEIIDPLDAANILHRAPGGGIEPGETPEQAVRRELQEELRIVLGRVRGLPPIDHVWFWKKRELRERAWIFLADPADDPQLAQGGCPELVEADGLRYRTRWRRLDADPASLPPLSPARLAEALRAAVGK